MRNLATVISLVIGLLIISFCNTVRSEEIVSKYVERFQQCDVGAGDNIGQVPCWHAGMDSLDGEWQRNDAAQRAQAAFQTFRSTRAFKVYTTGEIDAAFAQRDQQIAVTEKNIKQQVFAAIQALDKSLFTDEAREKLSNDMTKIIAARIDEQLNAKVAELKQFLLDELDRRQKK